MTDRDHAYRYDLFIAPEWSARFDAIIDEHLKLPTQGSILEINCGTGVHAIEMSLALEEGQVVGIDRSPEMLAIARAKAAALDADRCTFVLGDATTADLGDMTFDVVITDLSLAPPVDLEPLAVASERLAKDGGLVVVKAALRGSFDEFSSIYWEALYDLGLVDEVWPRLEALILGKLAIEDIKRALKKAGLEDVAVHQTKEEFRFDSGPEMLISPLAADLFLDEWLSIVPDDRVGDVRLAIARLIDRERGPYYFDFSAKAVVAIGRKR